MVRLEQYFPTRALGAVVPKNLKQNDHPWPMVLPPLGVPGGLLVWWVWGPWAMHATYHARDSLPPKLPNQAALRRCVKANRPNAENSPAPGIPTTIGMVLNVFLDAATTRALIAVTY